MNGWQYRGVFTNAWGTATSTAATLTVNYPRGDTVPSVKTNPSNATVNAGTTASFTAAASGRPTPTVQWEVSTDGGRTFTATSGATSTTYSFTASAAQNGYEYEAVFTNIMGTTTTTAATLTVDFGPSVTTQPASVASNAGQNTSFTAAASGNPSPTVQWEVNAGSGFVSLSNVGVYSGATTGTLSISGATAGMNGYQYDAVFTNSVGSVTTTAVTLMVIAVPTIGAWNSAVDSNWDSAANWIDSQGTVVPGFSGVAGDQAIFNGAGVQVDLVAANPVIAGLNFDGSAGNYIIKSTGGGQLRMSTGGGTATISVSTGSQAISAPVQLSSNTVIDAAASTNLGISGAIGGTGSLTVGDSTGTYAGTVVLGVVNNYSGGTAVSSGTLAVTAAGACPPARR